MPMAMMAALPPALVAHLPLLLVVLGFVLTAVLTASLSLLVSVICRRLGVLDQPDARRIHRVAVPRLGGVAIFLAFLAVSLLLYQPASAYELHVYVGLIAAALIVVVVMAVDDVHSLPPLPRLGAQVVAALVAMFPAAHGTLIEVIHNPLVAVNG